MTLQGWDLMGNRNFKIKHHFLNQGKISKSYHYKVVLETTLNKEKRNTS